MKKTRMKLSIYVLEKKGKVSNLSELMICAH